MTPCGTHTLLNKILGSAILKEGFNNAEIQADADYDYSSLKKKVVELLKN